MICAQQFVNDATLAKNYNKLLQSANRAVFLKDMYWDVHQKLNIYFYPLPPTASQLKWLNVSKVDNWRLDELYATVQGVKDPISAVKDVIQRLFEPLSLTYAYVSNPVQAHIRVAFNPKGGSWSYCGLQNLQIPKNQPTMSFGWLDVGCMYHEFCHALGMVHEHQNPRNSPLQWNVDALTCMMSETQSPPWSSKDVQTQIVEVYSLDTTNGSNFDPESIMLYFFPQSYQCKKQHKVLELTTTGASTHPNFKLSDTDWLWLTSIYPKVGERRFPGLDLIRPSPPPTGGSGESVPHDSSSSPLGDSVSLHWIIAFIGLIVVAVLILQTIKSNEPRR